MYNIKPKLALEGSNFLKGITNLDKIRRQYNKYEASKFISSISKDYLEEGIVILEEIKELLERLTELKRNLFNVDMNALFII